MNKKESIKPAIENFLRLVNKKMEDNYGRMNMPYDCRETVSAEYNSKYIKVVRVRSGKSVSVYAFIDYDGNIFKAASWRAPAKHARGTILDNESIEKATTPYGIVYL